MIETRAAIENLAEISATPGLAGLYVGLAHLSLAHGFLPGFDRQEPEMLAMIERIRLACVDNGIAACIHCGTADYARQMQQQGFALTTIGSDARFIEAGARAALAQLRRPAS